MNYLLLALVWIAWCAVHSAMISVTVTGFLERKLGSAYRFYRLFFNAFAIASLVPVIIYSHTLSTGPFFAWEGWGRVMQYAMVVTGVLLFFAGGRQYDLREFAGIRQLERGGPAASRDYGSFRSTGILGMVRHPFYLGVIVLLWARDLDLSRLVINTVITVYVVVGTVLEERKLVREMGDVYNEYRERVSMFIPLAWVRSKIKE